MTTHLAPKAALPAPHSPQLRHSNGKLKLVYSLDVLRLDSSKSSLNHLSSSMAFKSVATHPVPASDTGHSSPESQIARSAEVPQFLCRRNRSNSLADPWMFPFPIHPSSTRSSVLIDDRNEALERRANPHVSREEYNRRRHVCPICLQRFKRPSCMKTHLNSHTGATREVHHVFLTLN